MTTWSEAVDEYIAREGRRLGKSTTASYRSALRQAGLLVGPSKSMKRLTREDVEDILWGERSFLSRGLAPSTVNARRGQICTFLKWCLMKKYVKTDLTYKLGSMPAQKKIHRQLGAEMLLDALDAAPTPRDRIMLALGTFTGSRISEIKLFQLKHLDLTTGVLEGVITKTRKHYRAVMGPELRTEMTRWLAHYAREQDYLSAEAMLADVKRRNLDWYIVPRMTRPILTGFRSVDSSQRRLLPEEPIENVYAMTAKLFAAIGLEDAKGEGFHTLRRSAARHMYERACEQVGSKDRAMRMVQLYLNHSTMAITEKYVGVTVERAALDDLLDGTPLLGDAYAERYESRSDDDGNVVEFRRKEVS